jgi:hypothetical protein
MDSLFSDLTYNPDGSLKISSSVPPGISNFPIQQHAHEYEGEESSSDNEEQTSEHAETDGFEEEEHEDTSSQQETLDEQYAEEEMRSNTRFSEYVKSTTPIIIAADLIARLTHPTVVTAFSLMTEDQLTALNSMIQVLRKNIPQTQREILAHSRIPTGKDKPVYVPSNDDVDLQDYNSRLLYESENKETSLYNTQPVITGDATGSLERISFLTSALLSYSTVVNGETKTVSDIDLLEQTIALFNYAPKNGRTMLPRNDHRRQVMSDAAGVLSRLGKFTILPSAAYQTYVTQKIYPLYEKYASSFDHHTVLPVSASSDAPKMKTPVKGKLEALTEIVTTVLGSDFLIKSRQINTWKPDLLTDLNAPFETPMLKKPGKHMLSLEYFNGSGLNRFIRWNDIRPTHYYSLAVSKAYMTHLSSGGVKVFDGNWSNLSDVLCPTEEKQASSTEKISVAFDSIVLRDLPQGTSVEANKKRNECKNRVTSLSSATTFSDTLEKLVKNPSIDQIHIRVNIGPSTNSTMLGTLLFPAIGKKFVLSLVWSTLSCRGDFVISLTRDTSVLSSSDLTQFSHYLNNLTMILAAVRVIGWSYGIPSLKFKRLSLNVSDDLVRKEASISDLSLDEIVAQNKENDKRKRKNAENRAEKKASGFIQHNKSTFAPVNPLRAVPKTLAQRKSGLFE